MQEMFFRPLMAHQKIRGARSKPDALKVVNSERGGKKIVFSRGLYRKLGIEDKVYILTDEEALIVSGEALFQGCPSYNVRTQSGDQKVLYCADAAYEIADILRLDFSESVSQSVTQIEYLDSEEGIIFAFVYNEQEDS